MNTEADKRKVPNEERVKGYRQKTHKERLKLINVYLLNLFLTASAKRAACKGMNIRAISFKYPP
jgi:hypothetical protein